MSKEQLESLFGQIFLYLSIALAVCALVAYIVIANKKKEFLKKYLKVVLIVAFVYAIVVAITMLTLKFKSIMQDDDVDYSTYKLLLWPLVASVVVAILGGCSLLVCGIKYIDKIKFVGMIVGILALGCFIAVMICMNKYYQGVAEWYPSTNLIGLIVSAVCFIVFLIIMYFVGNKNNGLDTKSIVYGAISIALSFALSYIKFFRMPQAGSVTLASMLPLLIYSCMFGVRKGIVISLIYGVLQAVQDPWIIHPMQFLLDYPLAYGVIGISGIFMEKGILKGKKVIPFLLGGVLVVCLRYTCHVFSGVFAFADYANLDNYATAWGYSLVYNSSVFIDMVVALIAGSMLFASRAFVSQMEKSSETKQEEEIVLNDEDDEIDKMIIEAQEKDDNFRQ